jgi:orotate phosphoribosyltransferase
MTAYENLVPLLFKEKVIEVSTDKFFLLASGKQSPVYFDHRRLFSVPEIRHTALEEWSMSLRPKLPPNTKDLVVVGTATAGIAPAFALAERWGAKFCYVRSQAKSHGTGKMIEGVWEQGDVCLLVDDMITSGKSVLAAAAELKKQGGLVIGCTSFTHHPFESTLKSFAAEGIPLLTFLNSKLIFEKAKTLGLISEQCFQKIAQWFEQEGLEC